MFKITSLSCLRQHFLAMIFDFYLKFWQLQFRLYLLNGLLSQNPFPLVWKLLSCSFKISKSYGVTTIHFPWRKHIFLTIIQIVTEKHFSSNFWTADPLNMVDPSHFSFLKDLHTDNTLMANKCSKNIKWGSMWFNDTT